MCFWRIWARDSCGSLPNLGAKSELPADDDVRRSKEKDKELSERPRDSLTQLIL